MVQAYILIQTEVGKAAAVASAIALLDGVATAEDVTGPYRPTTRAQPPRGARTHGGTRSPRPRRPPPWAPSPRSARRG